MDVQQFSGCESKLRRLQQWPEAVQDLMLLFLAAANTGPNAASSNVAVIARRDNATDSLHNPLHEVHLFLLLPLQDVLAIAGRVSELLWECAAELLPALNTAAPFTEAERLQQHVEE